MSTDQLSELLQKVDAEQLIQYVRDNLEPHHIWSLKELQQTIRDLKEELV